MSAYNNPLDNSDVPIKDNKHSAVGGLFESTTQAQQYKLYLETLQLIASIKNDSTTEMEIQIGVKTDGSPLTRKVKIADLVPKESEFERFRRLCISRLNKMDDNTIRIWMARYGTDDLFELSSRITASQLEKRRGNEAFATFDYWTTWK